MNQAKADASDDLFTTETAGLPEVLGPDVTRLHDGDRLDLRIGPVRKNIDGAKLQWAVENHLPPTAVPADTDLFGENSYLDHKPDCPARGAYSLNAVREKCTCSVGVHTN